MSNLRDKLLQREGIDPSGAGPLELTRFRTLLEAEKKRARRLTWMTLIPSWGMFVILLGLCVSESLLEHMNVPFVTAGGAVVIGLWLVAVPMARRISMRLEQSSERIRSYKRALPEHKDIKPRGISLVVRKGDIRLISWPHMLLIMGVICLIGAAAGNVVWLLLTGHLSGFMTLWNISMGLILVFSLVYNMLTRPLQDLQSLEDRNPRYWIAVPRIPFIPMAPTLWRIGKIGWAGLLVFIGILSVYLFFQGNDVYARAMGVLKQARTIHAIGYNFKDGHRIKTSEIWYQRGRGTHIQCRDAEQVTDLYDDGQYSYHHTQGLAYAVKRQTQQPLLPRELTDTVRYLKWSRRDPSRDRQIKGRISWCYKKEDSNTLSLMWTDWQGDRLRFRTYEEYRWVQGLWEQQELIEIDYDLPMDLVMPPALFEQEGIRIVEPNSGDTIAGFH